MQWNVQVCMMRSLAREDCCESHRSWHPLSPGQGSFRSAAWPQETILQPSRPHRQRSPHRHHRAASSSLGSCPTTVSLRTCQGACQNSNYTCGRWTLPAQQQNLHSALTFPRDSLYNSRIQFRLLANQAVHATIALYSLQQAHSMYTCTLLLNCYHHLSCSYVEGAPSLKHDYCCKAGGLPHLNPGL